MTVDHLVALSLLEDLSRRHLTERLTIGDPELEALAGPLLSRAVAVRVDAAARGLLFAPWDDPAFPPLLLATPDCPPGLWYTGALQVVAAPCVAVVGSRAGSPVSLEMAGRLSTELAARGVTVVSGLARGVDSAAHRGALRRGRTVAVLGSGLDRVYPREHTSLAADVARQGCVLSEYPPGTPPLPFHFPMRNRIISGLSRAVVVIEASDHSGSLITAACALEQGREVMAVPGTVPGGRNTGGHALNRDGATIVESADDVLRELGLFEGDWARDRAAKTTAPEGSGDYLLSRMDVGEPYDLDDLASASGVGAPQLLPHLSALELEGRVRRVEGGRFVRVC